MNLLKMTMNFQKRLFIVSCLVLLAGYIVPCSAQQRNTPSSLLSPSVASVFYDIANTINATEDVNELYMQRALLFYDAALELDPSVKFIPERVINLLSEYYSSEKAELMERLLYSYLNRDADLNVTNNAVTYILSRLNSRPLREAALGGLIKNLRTKNVFFDSEMAVLLGLLKAEKNDLASASNLFFEAYSINKYNALAFEKFREITAERIFPAMELQYLRRQWGKNLLDLNAAMAFADRAATYQLYETAAQTYEYCAQLFEHLNPGEPIPALIYRNWMLCYMNTERNAYKCLQVYDQIEQQGVADLIAAVIAAKCAEKSPSEFSASAILADAEQKALQAIGKNPQASDYGQLSWFYLFGLGDTQQAIDWANKAYAAQPDSENAAALLALTLVTNGQSEFARPILDQYPDNQFAHLAQAYMAEDANDTTQMIEHLKTAIEFDPGSIASMAARQKLQAYDSQYIPDFDPTVVFQALTTNFEYPLIPSFKLPSELFSVELNLHGTQFPYPAEIKPFLIITNTSTEPFIIDPDGLFKGNVRIDLKISGDLSQTIPAIFQRQYRPSGIIKPDQSMLLPIEFVNEAFSQILRSHPQADLVFEFTTYIDPVLQPDGTVVNALKDFAPSTSSAKRPGVDLTNRYLQNRFNSLKGPKGQKMQSARLFSGLLIEQQMMAGLPDPLYRFTYAEWMPQMLESGLLRNLYDDDWTVKTYTMDMLQPLPLDYKLTNAVSENLRDPHWPTRMMALYLLSQKQNAGFSKVLDWYAKQDQNRLVRELALNLGGKSPQQTPEKAVEPNLSEPNAPSQRITQ